MMVLRVLLLFLIVSGFVGCRSSEMSCPEPQVVKLKKSSAYKLHIFDRKQKEKVMAQSTTYSLESRKSVRHKESRDIEEWDCPRPGSQQEKLNHKRLKRIQKNAESNPRKVQTIHDVDDDTTTQ